MANSVYDPESADKSGGFWKPGDGHDGPSGDSSDPRGERTPAGDAADPRGEGPDKLDSDGIRNAEEKAAGGLYNAGGDKSSGLAGAEQSAAESGGGSESSKDGDFSFNPDDSQQRGKVRNVLKGASRNKKIVIVGTGVLGGIVGTFVVAFFMLIPLKIEHIVTNLEKRFFATSENSLQKETEYALSRYIKKYVMPALKQCSGSTIDKNCNPSFGAVDNPVDAMYKGWSNARLENKLADRGIEIKYNRYTNKYYMKAPGIKNPQGDDISNFEHTGGDLFQEVSRGEARASIRQSLEDETLWKKMMFRYKVGRLLEEKYGIKRCLIFCDTRDGINELKAKKANVAQVYLVQRVLTPHTETMGIVMECLLSTSCNPTDTKPTSATDGIGETAGAPENDELDTALRERLTALSLATYGKADKATIDQMIQDYKDVSDKGFQKYFLAKVMEKIGLSELTDQVSDAVPVIGWIVKGSQAITTLRTIGPKIQKLSYVADIGGAVSIYSMYRTYADEIHTGNVDASQVGNMVDSLSSGNYGSPNDPEVGGTASAEQTPLYQNLISGNSSSASTSFLDGLLPGQAYADSSTANSSYTCADGKPVPSGKLVCHEEEFGKGIAVTNSISSFMSQGFIGTISDAAGAITKVTSGIGKIFSDILSVPMSFIMSLPVFSDISKAVSDTLTPFFTGLFNKVIPNPFSSNMSGGRKFDMIAAGADGAGNDYAHTGLGGKKLDNATVARIVNEQNDQSLQTFQHQSFMARTFDTNSEYSLVTRVAMATPISLQASAQSGFASLLSNPFAYLLHGFGAIFSTSKASAATPAQDDAFGITQYGYDNSDIPTDPEAYWDQHCSDNAAQAYQNDADYAAHNWNQDAADHPDTGPDGNGMPVNTTTNPCLLIKGMAGAAGGKYDSSLLTSDEQQDLPGAGGSGTTASSTDTGISGNGSGKFTTNTSQSPYPGLDKMLARVKAATQSSSGAAAFCASIGGCSGKCESAVEMAWLGHRGQYLDPFGSAGNSPASGSAWAAALASGHAHPGDRNPPVGALLIYNAHNPSDPYGHITIYLGNNLVFSTDFDHQGSVGIDPASHIETGSWANSYVGWMDPYFSGQVGSP